MIYYVVLADGDACKVEVEEQLYRASFRIDKGRPKAIYLDPEGLDRETRNDVWKAFNMKVHPIHGTVQLGIPKELQTEALLGLIPTITSHGAYYKYIRPKQPNMIKAQNETRERIQRQFSG